MLITSFSEVLKAVLKKMCWIKDATFNVLQNFLYYQNIFLLRVSKVNCNFQWVNSWNDRDIDAWSLIKSI